MKRTVPLLKTVVPAISQIPSAVSFSVSGRNDLSPSLNNAQQGPIDQEYVEREDATFTTTSQSTFTSIDTSLTTASNINDVGGVREQIDVVFQNLQPEPSAHPAVGALTEAVKATARDPVVIEKILNLPSFQSFVNSIPPAALEYSPLPYEEEELSEEEENLQRRHPQRSVASAGTQTEDSYMYAVERRLQSMSLQLAPSIGLPSSTPPTSTSSFSSSTHTTVSTSPLSSPPPLSSSPLSSPSSLSSPASTTASSSASFGAAPAPPIAGTAESAAASPVPDVGNFGNAGQPAQSPAIMTALKCVLPLVFLTVAAAVLHTKGALTLLKSGFKVISRRFIA